MSTEPPAQYNIHDAKTHLSRILDRVEHGEEIIISRAGHPIAKVIPLFRTVNRTGRGSLRGEIVLTDGWDSPETNAASAGEFRMLP